MTGKKFLYFTVSCFLMTAGVCSVVCADEIEQTQQSVIPEERLLPRVVDEADLLTAEEESELLSVVDEISERQQFDVAIVTVESMNGASAQNFADDFYDYNGYGMGENADGALLLVSMEDRDWYITTAGFGITAITDAGIDYISDRFIDDLSDGEYYSAFETYARLCDDFVTQAKTGEPYDGSHMPRGEFRVGIRLLIAVIFGYIIAQTSVEAMRRTLKSVRPQRSAGNYIVPGSLKLNRCEDRFLYSNVTRTERPKENSSGSSIHTSSSGRSHGGGGGKF